MTTNHFRRGQSKVYYASDVWDPGEGDECELARTSFRSSCSEDDTYGNNDDFVASLMRRNTEKSIYREEEEEEEEEDELMEEEEEPFSLPTYAKPLPLLGHPSRHSVLNR